MQTDPEERLSHQPPKKKSYWGIIAIIVALVAAAYFYSAQESVPTPIPALEESKAALPQAAKIPAPVEQPPAPDIPPPVATEAATTESAEAVLTPALTLDTSDNELREDMAEAGNSALLLSVLAKSNLVERSASVIDGFSRGAVPYKVLPLKPPEEKFTAVNVNGQLFMDTSSYHRYDAYAQAIGELNTATLAGIFFRFRPLLEEAYASLGYSGEELDNALIRSFDRVLATPQVNQPIELKKKEAMYLYADAQLEDLTEMQKLLLRMGPENIAVIKKQVKELRTALLSSSAP